MYVEKLTNYQYMYIIMKDNNEKKSDVGIQHEKKNIYIYFRLLNLI